MNMNMNMKLSNISITQLILEFEKIYYHFWFFSKYLIDSNLYGDYKYLFNGRWLVGKFIYEFDYKCINFLVKRYKHFNYKFNFKTDHIDLVPIIDNFDYLKLINRQKYLIDQFFHFIYDYTTNNKYNIKSLILHFIVKINFFIENIVALFYYNNINLPINNIILNYKIPKYTLTIKWIPVIGGLFNNYYIKSFHMTENPISVGQYIQFILKDGYKNKKYWSELGWNWKTKYNIDKPDRWDINFDHLIINGKNISYYLNHPVNHISYWEAEAYCNWIGGKLPTCLQWEWVASNRNKSTYPLGINKPNKYLYNVNLTMKDTIANTNTNINKSIIGFNDLYGNVWEWCDSSFSKKTKIIKGGSWVTCDYILSNQLERNINQNCRYFPIGFRVIKN